MAAFFVQSRKVKYLWVKRRMQSQLIAGETITLKDDLKKFKRVIISLIVACADSCNGSIQGGGIHCTDETVCGTWIDGKPIYRMINLYGNMMDNKNYANITLQASFHMPDYLNGAVNMYYHMEYKKILYHLLNCSGLYSGCTAYTVLEYTKETDYAS